MKTTTSTAYVTQDDLENIMALFAESKQRYEAEIKILKEKIRLLEGQLYGRKSEKTVKPGDQKQLLLFKEEEELPSEQETHPEEETETVSYKRKKRGRRPLPADLPRVEKVHDLDEEDKV